MTPLPLEHLDPAWVPLINEAVGLGRRFPVPYPGGTLDLQFTPTPPLHSTDREFEVNLGGVPVRAGVADFGGLLVRAGLLGEDAAGVRLPESLVPALAEALLEPVLREVQTRLGAKAGPVRVLDAGEAPAEGVPLPFVLADGGGVVTQGRLVVGPGLVDPVRRALGALPKGPAGPLPAFPVFADVEMGRTTLPLSAVADLAVDDVIVADGMAADPENAPVVRLGPRVAFATRREGAELVLLGRTADDPTPPGAAPADAHDPPVELAFVLGRVAVPHDTATTLGAGSRLAFATDPASAFPLVGGGRTVGFGRLLRVGDRVLVRFCGRPELPWRGGATP